MRARRGLRDVGEPGRPRVWAPRRGKGVGPQWRPRRLARGGEGRKSRRRGLSETLWRRRGSRAPRTLRGHCPSAAGPAHCRHRPRPRPRPAHRAFLCGAPRAGGPAPGPAQPTTAALPELEVPPTPVSPRPPRLPLRRSGNRRPRPAPDWTPPSPAPGPVARPGSDPSPGDTARRTAPGRRSGGIAAEPARPLKGTGGLGSARFPRQGVSSPAVFAKEATLFFQPPQLPRSPIPAE